MAVAYDIVLCAHRPSSCASLTRHCLHLAALLSLLSLATAWTRTNKQLDRSYSYDKVFGPYATQEEVFAGTVRPIVDEMMQGYNCTVFA